MTPQKKNTKLTLTIAWLYPDLMSTYGDRGNIIALVRRCEWRGISVTVKELSLSSTSRDIASCDLLFMGGGEDRQQKIAAEDMKQEKADTLGRMIHDGIPGLYICGAYQFLGKYYKEADGTVIEGLNILDLYTENPGEDSPRLIGNVAAKIIHPEVGLEGTIIGFENHGGRTYLGKDIQPLGQILKGNGNNDDKKDEGILYKNTIGSYFHGPLLPKNQFLTDFLIRKALLKKYQTEIILKPLDDSLEEKAHQVIARRLRIDV